MAVPCCGRMNTVFISATMIMHLKNKEQNCTEHSKVFHTVGKLCNMAYIYILYIYI